MVSETPIDYWSHPPDQLLAELQSMPDGLSTAEAQGRLEHFGLNALKIHKRVTAGAWGLLLAVSV